MSCGLHRSAGEPIRRPKTIRLPFGRLEMNFRYLVAHLDLGRRRPARPELDGTLHGLHRVFSLACEFFRGTLADPSPELISFSCGATA